MDEFADELKKDTEDKRYKDEEMLALGRRLAKQRERRGYSRKELGERIGMSYNYLSEIENGERNPTIKTVRKICLALNISADALLFDKEEQTYEPVSFLSQKEIQTMVSFCRSFLCEIERKNGEKE